MTRVLVCSEFTKLNTGYAIYCKELLTRLHKHYEVAEFATYCDPIDHQEDIKQIPWKVFPNLPNKNNQEEVSAYNADHQNVFGKWKFEDVVSKFKPHVVCFPPNTIIMTENGYIPICDIKQETKVLTHTGNFQKVLKTIRTPYTGKINTIKINGSPETLRVTPEHPILCFKKQKQTNKKKSIKTIYSNEKPVFVPAKDIKEGDLVCFPLPVQKELYREINITDYLDNFKEKNNKIYPIIGKKAQGITKKIRLDYDLGKFLGYLLSDGCIHEKGISFTFHHEEKRFVDDISILGKNIFNCESKILKHIDKKSYTISFHSIILAKFLSKWIIPIKKNIPKETYFSNIEFVKGIICGLIRGDGNYSYNTVALTTTRKKLAYDYRVLCSMLSVTTTLTKRKNTTKYGKSTVYRVESHGTNAEKLHKIIQKHDNINIPDIGKRNTSRTKILDNYIVATVKRNRSSNYDGQVYNLEVENDNSYVAQHICVHNCAITDYWMANWINESPYRKYFNFVWMVPCDSYPQHEDWVDNFAQCDGITTYTNWSKNILENHGLKVFGVTSPGKNNIFRSLNKTNIKKNFGLEDKIIIGTVMRNQKRKLFPELFEGFRKFLDKTKRSDVLLYCHTSYPDVGWDIPKLLIEHGVSSKVLFTYVCKNCGLYFPSFYNDVVRPCLKCQHAAKLANVNTGLSTENLCVIYNSFDLYIQPATIEGFGIPLVEAASCNIPIAATNFSAMEEITTNLNGYKIDYYRLALEQETGRYIPTISTDSIASIIEEFSDLPEMIRLRKGFLTGQAVEKHYNWNQTELVWKLYIDTVNTQKYDQLWKLPPQIHHPNLNIPNNLDNTHFIKWAISYILGKPNKLGSALEAKLLKQLNFGQTTSHFLMGYSEDLSMFGRPDIIPFNREQCVNYLLKIVNKQNFWESKK